MSALEPMMIGPQSYNTKSVWRAGNPWPHNHWTLDHGTQEKGPWKRNPGPKLPRPQTTGPILKGEEMRLLRLGPAQSKKKQNFSDSKIFRTLFSSSGHFLDHPDTLQIIHTPFWFSGHFSDLPDTFRSSGRLSDHLDRQDPDHQDNFQIIWTLSRSSHPFIEEWPDP